MSINITGKMEIFILITSLSMWFVCIPESQNDYEYKCEDAWEHSNIIL